MIALLIVGAVFLGIAVLALMTALSTRRARTSERLSTIQRYGFEGDAVAAPLLPEEPTRGPAALAVTWVGEVVGRRVGSAGEAEMRKELMAAGMYSMSPRTLLGYRVVAAVLSPLIVLALVGTGKALYFVMILLFIPMGWLAPLALVRSRARQRLNTIDLRLPDLIDLLTVMVEAGMGFNAALRMAADQQHGPLGDELRLTLQEQTMGLGSDTALANLATRCDTASMKSFVRSMAQGERMGISTGQIMRNLAHEMRARRRSSAEERAQKAPVKMLFPLAFLIFPSIFIILVTPAVIKLVHTLQF